MHPLIVQTGSVPELIYVLQRVVTSRPVRVLALDSENVLQYLREFDGLQVRVFQNSRNAQAIMGDWQDSSPVYYIGGSAFPFIQRKVCRLFSGSIAVFPGQYEDWPAFRSHFQSHLRRDAVLVVQTERAGFIEEYLQEVFPQHHFSRPSLSLLCSQRELPHWKQLHPDRRFWTYERASELTRLVFDLRRQHFDACVVFFTGNSDFPRAKLIALLCGARQKIAVNEYGQFIEISPTSLLRFGLQRWRHGVVPKWSGATRVLVVQTWNEEGMRQIFQHVQEGSFFGKAQYYLFTRDDKAAALAQVLPPDQVLTYPSNAGPLDYWRSVRTLRKLRFDAAVAAFTEESTYLTMKWVPFLAGIRHKLIFNRHYDCFFFSPRRFFRYWAGRHVGILGVTRVLIVQTWDEARTKRILDRLQQGSFFRRPQYHLLTREDKAGSFRGLPLLSQILTYPEGSGPLDYWRTLRDLRKLRFDAAVVAFTEEPTYLKLKWIPFLAGMPDTLIFNRHYDCFFFTPGRLVDYWIQRYSGQFGDLRSSAPKLIWWLFLPILRGFLFPLRFFYLVTSITIRQIRRAYNSQHQ
ncbi:MAG TPA: hypothetical protein VGL91_11395 [Acidobacteriota bacterium]|jgi:ADP-heptose:LPS heptosyltransferase